MRAAPPFGREGIESWGAASAPWPRPTNIDYIIYIYLVIYLSIYLYLYHYLYIYLYLYKKLHSDAGPAEPHRRDMYSMPATSACRRRR